MESEPYAPETLPKKPEVTPEDFFAIDLRAGKVVAVEDFPAARKPAYKIAVDFGAAVGVLATSAQVTHYSKGELRGRVVVGAINMGSKHIAGFESQFLILGTLDPDGRVRLLQVEDGTRAGAPIA